MSDELRVGIYVVWFLATSSDAISSLIVALRTFKQRPLDRAGRVLGGALLGISLEAGIAAASLLIWWRTEIEVAPAFALCRVIGRSVKSVMVWRLALYMLSLTNGKEDG